MARSKNIKKLNFTLIVIVMLFQLGPTCYAQKRVSNTVLPIALQDPYAIAADSYFTYFVGDFRTTLSSHEILNLPWEKRSPNFGIIDEPVWIKVTVNNPRDQKTKVYLAFKGMNIANLDLYRADKEKLSLVSQAGYEVAQELRPVQSKSPTLLLDVDSLQTHTYLIRIGSQIVNAQSTISDRETYLNREKNEYIIFSLFYGAVLILLLYNLFIFVTTREKASLDYMVYLFLLGATIVFINGIGSEYLWGPSFNNGMTLWAPLFLAMAVGEFAREFLDVAQRYPKTNRIFLGTYVIYSLIFLMDRFGAPQSTTINLVYLLDLFIISLVFFVIIRSIGERYRPAYAFGLAWASFLLGSVFIILAAAGVIESNFFTRYGMQIGAFAQMAFLSLAVGDKLKDKLNQLNMMLDTKVKERTAELRTVLDNIKSGFFIVDENLNIQEGFTASCIDLFGKSFSQGKSLQEIFALNDSEYAFFHASCEQVFTELLPPSVTLSTLPKRLDISSKKIGIEVLEIRDKNHKISGLLFNVSDITKLAQSEHKQMINHAVIHTLKRKNAFIEFVRDFKQMIHDMRNALGKRDEEKAQELVRLHLHTLKGNCGVFHLNHICHQIHMIEELETITVKEINLIESLMQDFVMSNLSGLGIYYSDKNKEQYHIEKEIINSYEDKINKAKDSNEIKLILTDLMTKIKSKSFEDILGPIDEMISRISMQLNKKVSFNFEKGDTSVDAKLTPVIRVLPHLIRNSLDHGLERSEERLAKGKKEEGLLHLGIERLEREFIITLKDDGRGIDKERVAQIALQNKIINQDQLNQMNDEDKLMLIFKDGLSTAETITELSGRGVGMAAVYKEIKSIRGDISIKSDDNGCEFIIKLPAA